jgi:hypothetical protein
MIEKIKTILKNFIASLKAKNLKDIAIALLIFSLLIVSWRTYYLWQKGKKLEKEQQENSQKQKENQKIIDGLKAYVDSLIKDVASRDKKIAERDIKIKKTEDEKKQINDDFEKFKNDLKKKSQKDQDLELENNLKQHNIDVKVVATKNYIEIISQERLKLNLFVIDYDKIFTLNKKNEDILIPDLKFQIIDLKSNEESLKKTIDTNKIICDKEKENLGIDLTNMTKSKDNYKKKAFWSKIGGIAGVILTILIMK